MTDEGTLIPEAVFAAIGSEFRHAPYTTAQDVTRRSRRG